MLEGHRNRVYAVAFSSDGNKFASASYHFTVRLWDGRSEAALQTLDGYGNQIYDVDFSLFLIPIAFLSNSKTIALATDNSTIRP